MQTNLSIQRQCELLGLSRSTYYYEPCGESPENLLYMNLIDRQYLRTPFYGVSRMTAWLRQEGYPVNEKRVRRLMRLMDLHAIYPKPRLSRKDSQHRKYPYLLKDVDIAYPDQVWSTDITYIPLNNGFVYLVAVIDWYSRYVLSWQVSNSLDVVFCLDALQGALGVSTPETFNTDQGSQFTSLEFTGSLESQTIRISMDGRGRAFDNIFIERLWRTVKYEEVYIKSYDDVHACRDGLADYFRFYNEERVHQALGYRTPERVYWDR
jgi:putative transposase